MMSTREVLNQSTTLSDHNLFAGNAPLQQALARHHPDYDRQRFARKGIEAGSAVMQEHARLANVHGPRLKDYDKTQGGSDVRANSTTARFKADGAWGRRYNISGHKWHSEQAVLDAFRNSRLDGAADAFGLLTAGTDLGSIIERAWPSREA